MGEKLLGLDGMDMILLVASLCSFSVDDRWAEGVVHKQSEAAAEISVPEP